ncbi:GNAT family N-acetyltransferase [Oceanirhabdus sp. W0125-5]|uniref:GNAT family N-acetyltransferase n=1 Tax=Oceanirhabdus sp. W0125-5 TaxID=2999116 RepID=UPI0022F2E150|nr:GNAT family N-acetyltransferase [Oceanirhabdus sp. W0125-5]WBW96173.1 GNAT family N-acetyltransferase [Oceanirhabdus sp. W0125-5]
MGLIKWDKDIKEYKLSEEYSIHKAEVENFVIHIMTYSDKCLNKFAINSWDKIAEFYGDNEFTQNNCYWIKNNGEIVGGVIIAPNIICDMFLIPPFEEKFKVMKLLKRLLIEWSDKKKDIFAYEILNEEVNNYLKLGFRIMEKRCWLIRPTVEFDVKWDDRFRIEQVQAVKCDEMAQVYLEANIGGVDDNGQELNDYVRRVGYYFKSKENTEIFHKASTLIYDNETNELVGVCLISMCEGWPLVFDVAVKPSYRRMGLATNMLKRALTELKEEYKVLVLYVTQGNDSEAVYHNLGFIRGVENTKLYIPKGTF